MWYHYPVLLMVPAILTAIAVGGVGPSAKLIDREKPSDSDVFVVIGNASMMNLLSK